MQVTKALGTRKKNFVLLVAGGWVVKLPFVQVLRGGHQHVDAKHSSGIIHCILRAQDSDGEQLRVPEPLETLKFKQLVLAEEHPPQISERQVLSYSCGEER